MRTLITTRAAERVRSLVHNYNGSGQRAAHVLDAVELRALVDASNSVADLDRRTDWSLTPTKGGRIAPLCSVFPATTNIVATSVENTRTEATAPTAYNTALPEGAITFVDSDETPKRVGSWVPVTRGAFEDEGAVREMVESLLESDYLRALDTQILTGDGTGESLLGVLNTPSLPEQPLSTDTRSDALVKAATTIRNASHDGPITVVANPADVQDLVLEAEFADRWGAAFSVVGIEAIIPSVLVPAGTFVVASWSEGAHIYLRSGLEIAVSADHDDLWLQGKVAVAAESRVGFKVVQKSAFVSVTGV